MTMTLQILDITAENGVPFRVVHIPAEAEGPNPYRHPADNREATVEFYDRRREHAAGLGQFTGGSYYVSTLLGREANTKFAADQQERLRSEGLNVHGGVPDWTIDGQAMCVVLDWLALLSER